MHACTHARMLGLFLVQHFVQDVFLAIVEVAMMNVPEMQYIVTASTFMLYLVLVLTVRPLRSCHDLFSMHA